MSEKIKYLRENKSSNTFSIAIDTKNYKFHKTYKTKIEAQVKLDEITSDLDNLKLNKINISDSKILVSDKNLFLLTKFKWSINKKNYAESKIDGVTTMLHRYIKIVVDKIPNLTSDDIVDHINGIKYDNRDENLRIVTVAQNAQNKLKQKNTSSTYYGVTKIKDKDYYQVMINNSILDLHLRSYYENELHAAWQWNLWIVEYQLNNNKNNIIEPENFVCYVKEQRKNDLPFNIKKSGNSYQFKYKKYTKTYKTLEQTITELELYKQKCEKQRTDNIYAEPINRNKNGFAIISIKKQTTNYDVIVDDEDYYKLLVLDSLSISIEGYAVVTVDKKRLQLHRYILNYYGSDVIDHINGETIELKKLDNRKCNLQIVTKKLNNQNRMPLVGSSSKYIGVSWSKQNNKWKSTISTDGKDIHLGFFINEADAAHERDIATKKYFTNGKYNFIV